MTVLRDSRVGGGGGGGSGDSISVNGVAATDANFNDSTPTAPTGMVNIKWQKSGAGPASISAYVDQSKLSIARTFLLMGS